MLAHGEFIPDLISCLNNASLTENHKALQGHWKFEANVRASEIKLQSLSGPLGKYIWITCKSIHLHRQSIEMKNTGIEETLYDRIGGQKGLKHLLTHFYADVRQHAVIGPIFEAQIQDWPMHIEKIVGFWSGLTGGPSLYGGGLIAKHMPLHLQTEHFGHWLTLWAFQCDRNLAARDAEMMKALANQIGDRLKQFAMS